jgi:hypothetical protein
MSTIKISQLATTDISLSDFIIKADSQGIATKNTVQGLSNLMTTVQDLSFKGSISISDTPSQNGWYFASESGTYTNLGGIVVDTSDNIAILIVSGSSDVFEKIDIPVNVNIDSVPTPNSTNAVSSGGVSEILDNNIILKDSRLNSDTVVTSSDAGQFNLTSGTLSSYEDGVKIMTTGVQRLENYTFLDNNSGQTVYYEFYAKKISGDGSIRLAFGNTVNTPNSNNFTITNDWVKYSGSLPVGSVNVNRIAFFTSLNASEISLRDFNCYFDLNDKGVLPNIEQNKSTIETEYQRVNDLEVEIDNNTQSILDINAPNATNNILAEDSRFDENSVISGSSVGNWITQAGGFNLSKNVDESFNLTLTSTGTIRFVNLTAISSYADNDEFEVLLEVKRVNPVGDLFFDFTTSTTGQSIPKINNEWQILNFNAVKTPAYTNRIGFIMTNSGIGEEIHIRPLVIAKDSIQYSKIKDIESRLNTLETSTYEGKKISVIADSIGTLYNNNAVEIEIFQEDIDNSRSLTAYVSHWDVWTDSSGTIPTNKTIGSYTLQDTDIGNQITVSPIVGDVGKTIGEPLNYNSASTQTWCKLLSDKLGMNLIQNVAWSGSKITSKNETSSIYKTSHSWHPATINKCKKRSSDNTFTNPDVILISRVTNDFSHSPTTLITDYDNTNFTIPSTDVVTGGYGYKEGIALTIKKIREEYPLSEVWIATGTDVERNNYSSGIVNNGSFSLNQYNEAVIEMASLFSCRFLRLDKCGVNISNIGSTYSDDGTHLNQKGHSLIADRLFEKDF